MALTIRSNAHAYKVADHVNERLPIGGVFEVAGDRIVKIDDREFLVNGQKFICCELADCLIWPKRKAWNMAIKAANTKR